jgi:predicted CopG family antitoxin
VIYLSNYTTISVPDEVKRTLEKVKGNKEWGEFLLELYKEADRARRVRAFEKLAEILSPEDLEAVAESSRGFRQELKLR